MVASVRVKEKAAQLEGHDPLSLAQELEDLCQILQEQALRKRDVTNQSIADHMVAAHKASKWHGYVEGLTRTPESARLVRLGANAWTD